MKNLSEAAQTIAEDIYQRFRLLALVIDKSDNFVGMTPAGAPVANEAPSRWLQSLLENRHEVKQVADDLVLRAFGFALEPANFKILQILQEHPIISFSDLMHETGLNRLSLNERINDMRQVGLAGKDFETDVVQRSPAAEVLVAFVQQTQESLTNLIIQQKSPIYQRHPKH